jgi:hypothetical protein
LFWAIWVVKFCKVFYSHLSNSRMHLHIECAESIEFAV